MTNVDTHTTMMNGQPLVLYAVAVARRTTGSNSVEAPGEGAVHQDIHPNQEGHRKSNKEDTLVVSSSAKAGDKEEEEAVAKRNLLPKDKV